LLLAFFSAIFFCPLLSLMLFPFVLHRFCTRFQQCLIMCSTIIQLCIIV
jgi:hypothetical protein